MGSSIQRRRWWNASAEADVVVQQVAAQHPPPDQCKQVSWQRRPHRGRGGTHGGSRALSTRRSIHLRNSADRSVAEPTNHDFRGILLLLRTCIWDLTGSGDGRAGPCQPMHLGHLIWAKLARARTHTHTHKERGWRRRAAAGDREGGGGKVRPLPKIFGGGGESEQEESDKPPIASPILLLSLDRHCSLRARGELEILRATGGERAMQAAASWSKSLPGLRSHLCAASSFHSTPVSPAKWKAKWDCKHEHGERKLSKKYERYVVRQKRAEGKKALKDHLLYGKPAPHLQDGSMGSFANSHDIPRFRTFRKASHDQGSTKSRQGVHHHRKSKKDKAKFYNFFHQEHYVNPENIFEAIFGEHHGFTWSHISWEGFRFGDSSSRFRRTGESRRERVSSESEDESDDDTSKTTSIGSHAHRVVLGLPPCGPLTLDDVKTAFRASALRWHPDKHPGSSQAVAEEKFKLCVNAYNTLCSVLRTA